MPLDRGVFDDALARRLQLRHDARIEQPRHIEIIVVVFLQLDYRGDVIGVGQQNDLGIFVGDMRQRIARRQGKCLIGFEVGARDDVKIFVNHHGGGEPANRSLEGEKLPKLVAVVFENRLVARDLESHQHDVGAHDLCVIAQIGFRHDQRILDRRAGARGEKPVEAAVERDAGDNRHQDRGRGGDDGEHADDAHMQPRGGPSGAASLHHLPDFPYDDTEQQNHGDRVRQQQRHHDVMGGRNRREIGEDDEGGKGRQQRKSDRDRTEHPRPSSPRRRPGKRGVCDGGLFDVH